MHILNAHMVRTYPEAHKKTHIYVCTYETHINGNPIDYELSVPKKRQTPPGGGRSPTLAGRVGFQMEACDGQLGALEVLHLFRVPEIHVVRPDHGEVGDGGAVVVGCRPVHSERMCSRGDLSAPTKWEIG